MSTRLFHPHPTSTSHLADTRHTASPGHLPSSRRASLRAGRPIPRSLLALGLLLTALRLSTPLVALGVGNTQPNADDDHQVVIGYSYLEGQDIPEIPAQTTADGRSYSLSSQDGAVVDETYEIPTTMVSRVVTKDVPLDGVEHLDQYFEQALTVVEGDLSGIIPRTAYQVAPVYESLTREVDRTVTIEDLPSNDVMLIPTTRDFTVTSDTGVGANTIATLSRAAVSYTVTSTDIHGLPTSYQAHVTYRGTESYLEIHHYQVTAEYGGAITSSVRRLVINATYQQTQAGTAIVEDDTNLPADIGGPSSADAGLNPLLLVGAGSVGAALPVIGGFAYLRRRRGRLVSSGPDGISVLCSVQEHRRDRCWEARIPRKTAIGLSVPPSEAPALARLGYRPSNRALDSKGRMRVMANGRVLYEGRVSAELPLRESFTKGEGDLSTRQASKDCTTMTSERPPWHRTPSIIDHQRGWKDQT